MGETILGVVDNGSREQLVVPGVYIGMAGVTGRLKNKGIAQQAGFYVSPGINILPSHIPDGTPIMLGGVPYRTCQMASEINGNYTFVTLNIKQDLEPRDNHPAATNIDSNTTENLAHFICGDKYESARKRNGLQLTRFFEAAGVCRFQYDGSDRYSWTLAALTQCTPNEMVKIISRLGSPHEYQDHPNAAYEALVVVNKIIRLDGLQVNVVGTSVEVSQSDDNTSVLMPLPTFTSIYVSPQLINEISALSLAKHDFKRLAELCRELNIAAAGGANMAIAMIVRAIVDHIPPVFACANFIEVANSYAGSKSFKQHMALLERSLRKVADGYLHTQIRERESIPTFIEVDF